MREDVFPQTSQVLSVMLLACSVCGITSGSVRNPQLTIFHYVVAAAGKCDYQSPYNSLLPLQHPRNCHIYISTLLLHCSCCSCYSLLLLVAPSQVILLPKLCSKSK